MASRPVRNKLCRFMPLSGAPMPSGSKRLRGSPALDTGEPRDWQVCKSQARSRAAQDSKQSRSLEAFLERNHGDVRSS